MKNRTYLLAGVATLSIAAVFSPAVAADDASIKTPHVDAGLAALQEEAFAEAINQFNTGFAAGEADGGFYIGRMLEMGVGVEADRPRALTAFRQAADAKSSLAMNRLGLMHLRGEAGVLQNFKKARSLICEAADQAYDEAEFNCAELLFRGVGGAEEFDKAIALYTLAADKGHIGAMNRLGAIYANAEFEGSDLTKAVNYFRLAAEAGNANGLYEYGVAAENGVGGVEVDLETSHVYYNLAGLAGHPGASEALTRVGQQLDPEALDRAQEKAEQKLADLRGNDG